MTRDYFSCLCRIYIEKQPIVKLYLYIYDTNKEHQGKIVAN